MGVPTSDPSAPSDNTLKDATMVGTDSNEMGDISNVSRVEVVQPASTTPDDPVKFTITQKQEDTRGRLAQYFLIGFFVCIISVGILSLITTPPAGQSSIDNLKEAVLTISGVLSGPLGFIIGFYFRKSEGDS